MFYENFKYSVFWTRLYQSFYWFYLIFLLKQHLALNLFQLLFLFCLILSCILNYRKNNLLEYWKQCKPFLKFRRRAYIRLFRLLQLCFYQHWFFLQIFLIPVKKLGRTLCTVTKFFSLYHDTFYIICKYKYIFTNDRIFHIAWDNTSRKTASPENTIAHEYN